jgi:hypothetical protein
VDRIRRLHLQGWSQYRLARHFNVNSGTICCIVRGETWKNPNALHAHGRTKKVLTRGPRVTPVERFWSYVDKSGPNGCWIWTRARQPRGHGVFGGRLPVTETSHLAHRLAYALVRGPIPASLILRHKCDNPPCVNPDHLTPGTVKENTWDMIDRGRAKLVQFVRKAE